MDDHTDGTDRLAPERLTSLLADAGHDVEITSVRSWPIGTGQMAASHRLELTFGADPVDVPARLVAKTPTGTPERRAMSANSYRTEVDFYRHVAPLLAARLPRCWAAWRNDSGDDFILLLEDLTPRVPGDQLVGCGPDQALAAVENLASVHGPLWDDPGPAAFLDRFDEAGIAATESVIGTLGEVFLERFADRLAPATRQVFERFVPAAGDLLRAQAARPVGIVHGDYRLDNLLFAPDGSDVAVVDWQTVGLGLPIRDLAFFIATSLIIERRRATEDHLIDVYRRNLAGYGVTGYDSAACRADFALGLIQVPLVVLFGSAIATITARGRDMFAVMAERGAAALVDHRTLELV